MCALNKSSVLNFMKDNGIYIVLFALLAIIIIQDTSFLSLLNLSNILTQSSVRIIIALGVAGLIVTQGTDLSAGRQVGLAAVIAATLLQSMNNVNKVFPSLGEIPIAAVIIAVCLVGAVIGLVNGLIIAYLNVTLNLILIYALSGVFYAFGGLLEAGRIGSATNDLGFMYELDAIAACVVGGVSFSGGIGTVAGVVTGVLIFTVINYGLTYVGVNPYWQYIIKGSIIIFAVALDSLKYAKKK